jgi:sulfoxide reductase heme-binding subunit YedZ
MAAELSPASRPSLSIRNVPQWTIYAIGFLPAAWYFSLGAIDELGADPLKAVENALGLWALRFLILGLAITPLRRAFGVNLLRYRRTVGLLAFYYAALHLVVYLVLDQGLDFEAVWRDVLKRPYITAGMLSFSLLVPLAITSSNAMIRRLGPDAWARLDRLVYIIVLAAIVHFILLVKTWRTETLIYAALIVVLLAYRALKKVSSGKTRRKAAA